MNPALVAVAIQQTPAIIAFLKVAFAHRNPDEPLPNDEEVIAAYQSALASSIAKDDLWIAEHGG